MMNKREILGGILSAIGGLIAIVSIMYLFFTNEKKQSDLQGVIITNEKLSEKISISIRDSIMIDSIKSILIDVENVVTTKDKDKYVSFFADKINRYYLKEDVNKNFVKNQINWYWKKYPSSSVVYNWDTFACSKDDNNDNNDWIVYLQIKNDKGTKVQDIITEIRFDSTLKINYIRDFVNKLSQNLND